MVTCDQCGKERKRSSVTTYNNRWDDTYAICWLCQKENERAHDRQILAELQLLDQ